MLLEVHLCFAQNNNIIVDTLKYQNIQEVEILSNKYNVERKDGKLIFNVKNKMTNYGENTIDILNHIPYIKIENNVLNILGKDGVSIMINGIKQNISKDNMMSYIKSIDSKDIKNIEVITVPPSKYEAEGNIGIININTKENLKDNWNLFFQNENKSGKYHINNSNISVNIKKNNIFLSLSAGYNNGLSQYINNNKYSYPIGEKWDGKMISKNENANFFNKTDIKFKVNNYLTMGINYNHSSEKNNYRDINEIFIINNSEYFLINSPAKRHSKTNIHTVNTYGIYGKSDKNKTIINIDYIGFNKYNDNLSTTIFYPTKNTYDINNGGKQKIENLSIAIDRTHLLHKWDFNYGGKISFSNINNNENSNNIYSIFKYRELTNSFYLSLSKTIGKLDLKGGVRMENTSYDGKQLTTNEISKREYLEWFPTLYLNYNINKKDNLYITYGRRIKRPGFSLLNPFKWYTTSLEYATGNIALYPYFIDNIELGYTHKNWSLVSYFSRIKNGFYEITISDNVTRNHMTKPYNAFDSKTIGIKSDYSIDKKWWLSFNEFNLYYEANKTELSFITNRKSKGLNFYFSTDNTFYINKNFSFNISWWLSTNGVSSMEYKSSANSIDVSIRKNFMNGNLVVGVYGVDILGKNKPSYTSYTNNIEQIYSFYGDGNRYYLLSISYRIGNKIDKGGNNKPKNEEEKIRIN